MNKHDDVIIDDVVVAWISGTDKELFERIIKESVTQPERYYPSTHYYISDTH